ncbi:MAG: hypothetical protein ACXVLT_01640 [Flavisolibacter sp.]
MTKLLVLLSLLFVYAIAQAQLKPLDIKHSATKSQKIQSDANLHCKTHNRYSTAQRRGFYPFSKAGRIELISYNWPDSVVMGGEVPLKGEQLDATYVKEVKVLSGTQIDSLTQILYNVGYKGYFFTEVDIKCYDPRNAIVFLDVSGKLLGFIELCFKCQKFRLSSQKIRTGDFCYEKYELLKTFFSSVGIEYGTQERN